MTIRDSMGQVIGSCCDSRVIYAYSFMVESTAVQLAVNFCKEIGIRRFILEGDLLQVVKFQKKEVHDWSPVRVLLEDTKTLLNSFA